MNYFTKRETQCPCGCGLDITDELRDKLNVAREKLGIPIIITSGARCKKHNKKVGGSKTSSHLKGLAIDIAIPDSKYRYDLMYALKTSGFTRIGHAKKFIHADIDYSKPSDVEWVY